MVVLGALQQMEEEKEGQESTFVFQIAVATSHSPSL